MGVTNIFPGIDAVLNYKVGGQGGGGSWIEMPTKDVRLPMSAVEADATVRGKTWRETVTVLLEATVELTLLWERGQAGFNAAWTAFWGAFSGKNIIGLQILDAASGAGLQADFVVTEMPRTEDLEDLLQLEVTCKIAKSDTAPSWLPGS